MTTLDLAGLAEWLDEHHTHGLYRVETLDRYVSASDGDEFARFMRGEAEPDRASKAGWLNKLRADTAAGRIWQRLRVVSPPLSDYVRYECEWGYPDNIAAGEQVRVLDLTTAAAGMDILRRVGDLYLVEDRRVALMNYDAEGRFTSATVVDKSLVLPIDGLVWQALGQTEDFTTWWAAHPEHHRRHAA